MQMQMLAWQVLQTQWQQHQQQQRQPRMCRMQGAAMAARSPLAPPAKQQLLRKMLQQLFLMPLQR
jgi:hypothetical protein